MAWRHFNYFPTSTPIPTKGGIKAKSGRGLGGERWWAKRWIAVLEGFSLGARLSRGRSYARSGQVLSIEIEPGVVNAKVQGSRPSPYKVTLQLAPLPPEAWDRVIAALSGRALFLAKLMAGEMPDTIEEAFQEAGTPLFPTKQRDLQTDCSCPDWSNPCKHIAAVYYLLGEEFDRDPFLIFALRGMSRETLLERLRPAAESAAANPPRPEVTPEPLAVDPAAFWSGAPLHGDFSGSPHAPAVTAPLLRRMGDFPFWRGEESISAELAPDYAEAASRGRELFLRCIAQGDTGGGNREG